MLIVVASHALYRPVPATAAQPRVRDSQRGWSGPAGFVNQQGRNQQGMPPGNALEDYGGAWITTEKADALEATARERANAAANAAAAAAAKSLEASMRGGMPPPAARFRPVPGRPSNYGYMQRVGALQQSFARYETSGRGIGWGGSVEEALGEYGGRPAFGPWGGYDTYDQYGAGYYAGQTYAPLRRGYYDYSHDPYSPISHETTARRLARRRVGGVTPASLGYSPQQMPRPDYSEATLRSAYGQAEAARDAARKAQEYAEAAEQAAGAQEVAARLRVDEMARLEQEAAAARDRANASAEAAAADASMAIDAEMAATFAAGWPSGGGGTRRAGGPALGAARRFEPNVSPDKQWWQ